jgi:hypothetical protein
MALDNSQQKLQLLNSIEQAEISLANLSPHEKASTYTYIEPISQVITTLAASVNLMTSDHDDQKSSVVSDFSTALITKVLHTSIRAVNAIRTVANSVDVARLNPTEFTEQDLDLILHIDVLILQRSLDWLSDILILIAKLMRTMKLEDIDE